MLSSAANALRSLEYLAEEGDVGVSELARHLGVTGGTSYRLIQTLVETGFAEKNESTRRYGPSTRLVIMAEQVRRRVDIGATIHDELVKLAAEVRETVNLAVLDDNKVLYIDKVLSDRPFGFNARIGSRLPVHLTALGRVLVAGLNSQEQEDVIRAIRHETVDPDSPRPPSVTTLRQLLRQAREQGFALDLGEYLPDISCIAMEVRGANDRVLGAISITAPTSRFPLIQDRLLDSIRKTAGIISLALHELGIVDLRSIYHGYVGAET